jgi:nucleotide-binding universal stress UspA family protein
MEEHMYRFNKLLVAVNFNSTDHSVLAYTSHIARLANSAKVYFVHVAENFEIPDEIRMQYPSLIEPLDEYALKRMKELTEKFFSDHKEIDLNFEVSEGEQVSNLLRMIKIKGIDLVLVGKASTPGNDNFLGEKLARKAPCSVMIIPDGTQPIYSSITLACDFSTNSLDAMDVARAFGSSAGLDSFTCLHVYDIPTGYYKTGKTYEEFSEVLKKNAKQQFTKMLKRVDMKDVKPKLELIRDRRPARAIEQYVKNAGVNLLMVGARGRANGAGILLGSITEQLIRMIDIPILAVKKKGTGLDILEAILSR